MLTLNFINEKNVKNKFINLLNIFCGQLLDLEQEQEPEPPAPKWEDLEPEPPNGGGGSATLITTPTDK